MSWDFDIAALVSVLLTPLGIATIAAVALAFGGIAILHHKD